MRRKLTADDIAPNAWGGLVLLAGRMNADALPAFTATGTKALQFGGVDFTTLDEYDDDDVLLSVTIIGSVLAGGQRLERERDGLRAAQMVIEASGRKPVGIFQGHAAGLMHWLMASYLDIDVVDVAANSRAHPTVAIGAMGCAGDPLSLIHQSAYSSGRTPGGSPVRLSYHGHIRTGEAVLRKAADMNGGAIMAARGMYSVGFLRERGAVGALSHQHRVGEAVLAAQEGPGRAEATAAGVGGRIIFRGVVSQNDIALREFDIGHVTLKGDGGEMRLGVFNEFMYADLNGERVTTFPDLQAALCPKTGNPLALTDLTPGREVLILSASRDVLPLGAGVWDPTVYPEIEAALQGDIASFALRGRS